MLHKYDYEKWYKEQSEDLTIKNEEEEVDSTTHATTRRRL